MSGIINTQKFTITSQDEVYQPGNVVSPTSFTSAPSETPTESRWSSVEHGPIASWIHENQFALCAGSLAMLYWTVAPRPFPGMHWKEYTIKIPDSAEALFSLPSTLVKSLRAFLPQEKPSEGFVKLLKTKANNNNHGSEWALNRLRELGIDFQPSLQFAAA